VYVPIAYALSVSSSIASEVVLRCARSAGHHCLVTGTIPRSKP
jgi:hypothetical protein